tara:strand:+ start:50 stop:661 length:612 start_codon:yes stop_codon:yes gene_type:complete
MKKYLFIILLVGVCFGQDAYPYFSDMAKQLEFEKKRIIISEGESTQQIITGGGSEFNPWSLLTISPNASPYLRDAIPVYKNAPIKTTYRYNSYFNIQRDGKNISEIEMLRVLGLNEEADRIISEFEKEIMEYNKNLDDTPNPSRSTLQRFFYNWESKWKTNKKKKTQVLTTPRPTLNQQLNTAQTKSLVEAYNRKLYSEIAKK